VVIPLPVRPPSRSRSLPDDGSVVSGYDFAVGSRLGFTDAFYYYHPDDVVDARSTSDGDER
jgi:hypothetical protein